MEILGFSWYFCNHQESPSGPQAPGHGEGFPGILENRWENNLVGRGYGYIREVWSLSLVPN